MRCVAIRPTFDDWRRTARSLLAAGIAPSSVVWAESEAPGEADVIEQPGGLAAEVEAAARPLAVPREFIETARRVAERHDPERWALLYRVLWRIVHEDRRLLDSAGDPDVARLTALERRVEPPPPRLNLLGEPEAEPASAAAFLPHERTLAALTAAAARCTGCNLYRDATQTVFGDGPADARAMFIGEQPGDQEDLQGRPFVGPAGDVLTRALDEAGLPRHTVYITNAVKHFKWEPRGKRRLHLTPRAPEIEACRPWLEAEIAVLRPPVIVCLGATAAQALMGPQFRIMPNRGRVFQTRWAPWLMTTIHPSAILRIEEPAAQDRAYAEFVADMRTVARRLDGIRRGPGAPSAG